MVAMLLQVIAPGEDKKYYLSGSKVICGAILMVAMLLQVIAPGEDKNLSGSKVICGAILMVVMLLQVIAPGEDKNSDDGDAASSDSTRRRQEPQWKQADMWRSTGGGDAASSDSTRRRQEPLQSVEQHKRAILLDAIQGATSSHVSSDWARFSGHEQSPSLKSQFSSSESEQSQITLLMSINGKLSHILDHISEQAKSVSKKENSAVEFAQESRNEEDWFNGVNLTLIPKRNIYTYDLSLLDIFFSKKELRESLLFPSMKSPKPSLCPEKVQRIIATIKRQFPTEPFDLAVFTTKANQKCRDS
eukprot:Em0007g56a